jgi:arylsulfatase A-like enzyme
MMGLSRDAVWMTPLAAGATGFIIGVGVVLVGQVFPKARTGTVGVFAGMVFAILEIGLYLPGVHDAAVLVLALGVSATVTRALHGHTKGVARFARTTTPWLAVLIVILGVGVRTSRRVTEQRNLASAPAAPPTAPNVVLITLDAVRAASLGLYGYSRPTTPHLDAFSHQGVTFERALSTAPWTLPSHASMFTGRWHHELTTDYAAPLDDTFPTIAEYLSERGYGTAGFVANFRYCGYETGLDRGFLTYEDYPISPGQFLSSTKVLSTVLNNFRLRRLAQNDQHLSRKSASQLNREVFGWIDRLDDRPFFVFLNYFDAHEPYLPPAPYDRQFGPGRERGKFSPLHRWLWEPAVGHANMGPEQLQEEIDAYDGAIAYLDQQVGEFLTGLESRGLLEKTLVIITADHGEEFEEHGVFEHGYSLYRAGVQVPLILRLPGESPPGLRVPDPVSLRDLPATIVDLIGLSGDSPFPGRSLAAYWGPAGRQGSEDLILSEVSQVSGHPGWFPVSQGDIKSLTYGGLRYIRNGNQTDQLFDFDRDIWEVNNLASTERGIELLERYRGLLDSALGSRDR